MGNQLENLMNDQGLMDDNVTKYMVKELFKSENIDLKTDLTDKEITALTRIYYLAMKLNISGLKNLLDKFIRLRVSKDRKGRNEVVEMMKAEAQIRNQPNQFQQLFGGQNK